MTSHDASTDSPVAEAVRLPTAPYRGSLAIADLEIQCFVLDDGRRVLSGRAVTKAMALSGRGQGMDRFATAKYLQPYMSERLQAALASPIRFTIPGGLPSPLGYEAFVLPELCNAVLDANDAGPLRPNQARMAQQAKILSRAFSTVGITALVDEATGYQEVRDRLALREILDRYISVELAAWAKRFPDEFYQELFRLKGWRYNGMSVRRPQLVGKLTNDVVYSRLAPGVLQALKQIEERDDQGRLRVHHHRRLTPDVGHPALEKHLHAVIALMRISPDWLRFKRALERAFPKLNATLPLPYDLPDDDD